MLQSFLTTPPPIHPDDLGPPPGSILLDPNGFFSDRTNATTAEGFMRYGKRIKVTFWAAHPPRGSCFTVYSPDLEPSVFGGVPRIVTTEDDLVLLRVPIYDATPSDPSDHDYFVYQAGTENKGPSLDLIPRVPTSYFANRQVGLLRCRTRDMYFVALLQWACRQRDGKFFLYLYNSDTKRWITKLMCLPRQKMCPSFSKVITIGGENGSMGWADIPRGIIICDVLLDDGKLRYIPLPLPAVPILRWPSASFVRDIIVLEGYIKYFEICVYTKGWEAVAWRRKASWKGWKKDGVIEVSEEADAQEAEAKEQSTLKGTLKGFYSGSPSLSVHDAGVVYILDKENYDDSNALVIAVDMRKQTLKGVAEYCCGRPLGYDFAFCGTGISKHLRRISSASENAETSMDEIVQAGKQEVPREGVQSQLSKVQTSRKCRGRRGHCRALKLN